jgi:hypothetical protein
MQRTFFAKSSIKDDLTRGFVKLRRESQASRKEDTLMLSTSYPTSMSLASPSHNPQPSWAPLTAEADKMTGALGSIQYPDAGDGSEMTRDYGFFMISRLGLL